MTLTDLIDKIKKYVNDTSVTDSEAISLLNEGALVVAAVVRLPSLAVGSGSVNTDISGHSVSMPADYNNWAYLAKADGVVVNLRSNIEELLMVFNSSLDNVGAVTDCTVQGNTLVYQPSPSSQVGIDLFYSEAPPVFDINELGYIPVWLPARFHKMLAVYAGSELWDDIEIGKDGDDTNTIEQRTRFAGLLAELVSYVTDRKTT